MKNKIEIMDTAGTLHDDLPFIWFDHFINGKTATYRRIVDGSIVKMIYGTIKNKENK